jgi:aminoglycoside phosphotransferase family enzyme/predicted kinase
MSSTTALRQHATSDTILERPVDSFETHISVLFCTPDRVYKMLKPMATDFLDHSTVERRAAAIDAELRLNRRFAPDVYLGTATVEEQGTEVDRMLVMRRLPTSRRLSNLIGTAGFDDHLRRVVHAIATIHAAAPVVTDERPMTTAAGMAALWRSSLDEIGHSVGSVIPREEHERVSELALGYLDHSGALFEQRRRLGMMRDGHGDLTAQDIFMLDDGPRILDCIAFDDDYRISDVLADVAFLAMDVERLAGPDAAGALMRFYSELSNEHHPSSLAHHYVAYRAHVRAKIELLRHRQGDESAASAAIAYHRQALEHLERARLRVIMIGGGPGTGKTTLARRLADTFNWAIVDSDTVRKDLHGIDHADHAVNRHPHLYSKAATDATYAELVKQATVLLETGESVVLDATWTEPAHRMLARDVATRYGAELTEFECECDPEIARSRIAKRLRESADPSDATPDLVAEFGFRHSSWPPAQTIDTSRAIDVVLREAVNHLTGKD